MERVAQALQEHFGGSSTPTEPSTAPQPAIKPEPILDITAPISLGELIDKITILQIKTQHLQGTALVNVKKELEALEKILNNLQLNIDTTLIQRLKEVNQNLWKIEDDIRDQERQKSFSETFIRLARSVYQQNDRRAAIKKEINTTYGSALVEEKSYREYTHKKESRSRQHSSQDASQINEQQRRTMSDLLSISIISIDQQRLDRFSQRNIHIDTTHQTLGIKEEELSKEEINAIATPELAELARQVKGSLGNAHSIITALKECISENRHRLILEDDTQLHPKLSSFVDENWNYIKNLDVLALGGNTDAVITFEAINGMPMSGLFTRNEDKNPDYQRINKTFEAMPVAKVTIYKLHKIFGSHAWIVSPKGARMLIEKCFPLDMRAIDIPLLPHKLLAISFDRKWNAVLEEIDAGICIPFLALTPNNEKSRPIASK